MCYQATFGSPDDSIVKELFVTYLICQQAACFSTGRKTESESPWLNVSEVPVVKTRARFDTPPDGSCEAGSEETHTFPFPP